MTAPLSNQQCEACKADAPKVSEQELAELLAAIPDWIPIVENDVMKLSRQYTFKTYKLAWDFTNKVSTLAEAEFHHPRLTLEWGKVTVTWWSQKIKGLHKNDFICAAKTDDLYTK